jgi:glycosyltransferase involved in cell wall biosynthesis
MRRVLMVSPHFPPDTSAGAHRVRLLAPHLPKQGWEPTVVSVEPGGYEDRLDDGLAELVPASLRVMRCRAWPARWTRRIGVGDLGLRAFWGLARECSNLLRREPFDALFITLYPTYPALLGPMLKRRFGIPFVLDYQDPWVGAWGRTVGGGPDARPDLKSRLSRVLAMRLEPRVIRAADAITAVSKLLHEQLCLRYPEVHNTPWAEIPLGAEPADFERLRLRPRPNVYFDSKDGRVHLCCVGTLLPLGRETLRAVLGAVGRLRDRRPDLYARLLLHFFGTSNQTRPDAPARVLPVARDLGVADHVTEIAPRIDYLDGLTVQTEATALLLMGSSERHYTASKLYPALLSGRPILAVYHRESSVVEILRRAASPPAARVVTYTDTQRPECCVAAIFAELVALIERTACDPHVPLVYTIDEVLAQTLVGRLARILEQVGKGR